MGIDPEKKEFARWWLWIVLLIMVSIAGLGIATSMGLFGSTVVERVVFEQSYQRKAAQQDQIATYEATLAELRARRAQPNLDQATKNELDTQISAVTARLNAARKQQ